MDRNNRYEQMQLCLQELFSAAAQIAEDDPDFRFSKLNDFCDVMWSDNACMDRYGLTRGDFQYCLESVWRKLTQ